MNAPTYTRHLTRREMHSSRAVAAVVTAVLIILVLAWLGTETVLSLLGRPPLLVSPPSIGGWVSGLPAATVSSGLAAAGAGIAVVGLILFLLAVLPGSRGRHVLPSERSAVVVDDDVVAAAISRAARRSASLVPEQVNTRISRRRLEVMVYPTSGVPVDCESVRAAVQEELSRYALQPAPTVKITVSTRGAVGV